MKTKTYSFLKKHIFTILCVVGLSVWNITKNLISAGADVRFSEKVVMIVKDKEVETWLRELIDSQIEEAMNDPFVLIDVLSSEHIERYAERKAIEVKQHVMKRIMKDDSSKVSIISLLAKELNIRDENVMPLFGKLLKAYKDGRISTSRNVRGDF